MKLYKLLFSLLMLILVVSNVKSQNPREVINFNSDWTVYPTHAVWQNVVKDSINLPHTWNVNEFEFVKNRSYQRTSMNYEKKFIFNDSFKGKRIFIYFEGANSVANVLVNQKYVGEHKGGYTRFCFEITDFVKLGVENLITVVVNNSFRYDVLPVSGDFNLHGGLHRPVSLIVTDPNCISPLDYASSGVYIKQLNVSDSKANIEVLCKLSLRNENFSALKVSIFDRDKKFISSRIVDIANKNQSCLSANFTVDNPILWDGKKNPYLYEAKVELLDKYRVVDEVVEKFGLRYFAIDPNKGFFLNGKYLNLYGFGRHEDVEGKSSALTLSDYTTDMELIKESGATAMRLTHYPHGKPMYDLCDKNGIVLWTEIPLVGPGGMTGAGYLQKPELEQHAKQILVEMIRQNFNHPSICFWGLFNEMKLDYDNPLPFISNLNQLAKQEDPSRLTTCATFLPDDNPVMGLSDLVGWNKYYGWYGGKFDDIGNWADTTHLKFPYKPISISEFGAGASIKHHTDKISAPDPGGNFHPEEWQTLFHEKHWEQLSKRPFIWGKFIWVLADFRSYFRNEGDAIGINDKGLVSYDRKIKKDAFYFYKANWNNEPMVYIADRRFTQRDNNVTSVKVFTNVEYVELFVNGKSMGKRKKDDYNRIIWQNIVLVSGKNNIVVKAKSPQSILEDECNWYFK